MAINNSPALVKNSKDEVLSQVIKIPASDFSTPLNLFKHPLSNTFSTKLRHFQLNTLKYIHFCQLSHGVPSLDISVPSLDNFLLIGLLWKMSPDLMNIHYLT